MEVGMKYRIAGAGALVGGLVGLFLLTSLVGARSEQIPTQQFNPGVCIHEVVVFPNADSIGIVWTNTPCSDLADVRIGAHWDQMNRSTAILPRNCGVVWRLPAVPAPMVDTVAPYVCSPPVMPMALDERRASP